MPEFIVEVLAPTDSLKEAKPKMERGSPTGVELGWLIDGEDQSVYAYREVRRPVARRHIREIAGEGPVARFVLKLLPIWKGL